MRLPPALAPWASTLALLDIELAAALGPVVRQLDQLISRHDPGLGKHGELNGYDGITRRGDPARILASEWAIADAVPEEFLRRVAAAELLHLAPACQQDQSRGRVAILVDTGPDQLGAARLVQLAAMIVLQRRASVRRTGLILGVLGDPPEQWREGDVESLLRGWLASRRGGSPTTGDLDTWLAELDEPDEMWLLTGPRLAEQSPGRQRMLVARESAWDSSGATGVEVLLDGSRVELALPRPELSIRALRGAAFRSAGPALVAADAVADDLRYPLFPAAAARLLARGPGVNDLVAVQVRAGEQSIKPRRYKFSGSVLAASFVGHRTVALTAHADELRVEVVGKPLGHMDQLVIPFSDVGLDSAQLADALDDLVPLYFASGDVICRLAGQWHRLSPVTGATIEWILAIHPGARPDQPRITHRRPGRIALPDGQLLEGQPDVILGSGRLVASSTDGIIWSLPDGTEIAIDEGANVLGLLSLGGRPALVTISPGGLIARVHTPESTRVLTRWSRGAYYASLHPVEPWLLVQWEDGRIEVADLASDERLMTVQASR